MGVHEAAHSLAPTAIASILIGSIFLLSACADLIGAAAVLGQALAGDAALPAPLENAPCNLRLLPYRAQGDLEAVRAHLPLLFEEGFRPVEAADPVKVLHSSNQSPSVAKLWVGLPRIGGRVNAWLGVGGTGCRGRPSGSVAEADGV